MKTHIEISQASEFQVCVHGRGMSTVCLFTTVARQPNATFILFIYFTFI